MVDGASGSADVDVNMGIYDGQVAHGDVNRSLNVADKVILLGEQNRLPHFPSDQRLRKLHAADPLVLFTWKVLQKIPETLRTALIDQPISLTLVRGDELLYFADYRCHQALHIGLRRHAIYVPQLLLHAAEERGYDHWAIAEGLVYGGWMVLDYLLLVEVLRRHQSAARRSVRLTEATLRGLVERCNPHRREHVDAGRSEVVEFVEGYRDALVRLEPEELAAAEPLEVARELYDCDTEQCWARDKMERIAKLFNYPRMFLFDRDIIHGVAREIAARRGQETAPRSFADLLHDYRDSMRFDDQPLMASFCKGLVPKPRAVFLESVVAMGGRGLRGFFGAYREAEPEVVELMHPLWMYLCSLTSDPAGVFSRVGRCRGLGRMGEKSGADGPLAGILIRLDQAGNYADLVAEVGAMGVAARSELDALIENQSLRDEDEWEVFKSRKQTIVTRAVEALDCIDGVSSDRDLPHVRTSPLQGDERIAALLRDNPYRLSSDPSGVLTYLRSYERSLREFGPDDPDTDFLLACLLLRLDRSEHHDELLAMVRRLGILAFSALHNVFEHIPEHDPGRRGILMAARRLWAHMLEERRSRAQSKQGGRSPGRDGGAESSDALLDGGGREEGG